MSRNDRHHDWAVSIAAQQDEPFLTCESVLSEAAFHLSSASAALSLIDQRLIMIAFNCSDHAHQLQFLAKRYEDRNPDLADLCLIRMSELHPKHSVITTNREAFTIYRRNKRDAIPLVCPAIS